VGEVQEFWPVECPEGEPNLLVCMSCLNEVYCQKIPNPSCPSCGSVSAFEAFTLESIQDWGTEELIQKAQQAHQDSPPSTSSMDSEMPTPDTPSSQPTL
jgi:hypothetical protein